MRKDQNSYELLYYHKDKISIFYLTSTGSVLARDSILISEKYNNYFTRYYDSPVASILCSDLNNDGYRDIITGASVAGRCSYILAFSGAGDHKPLPGFPIYAGNAGLDAESPMFGLDDIDNDGKYEIYCFGQDAGMYVWNTNGNVDNTHGDWLCQGHDYNCSKNAGWVPEPFVIVQNKPGRMLVYDNFLGDEYGGEPYVRYPLRGIPDNIIETSELHEVNSFTRYAYNMNWTINYYLTNSQNVSMPEFATYVHDSYSWFNYKIGPSMIYSGSEIGYPKYGAGITFYSKKPFEDSYYLLRIDTLTGYWRVFGMSNAINISLIENYNRGVTDVIAQFNKSAT
jgi:hypothetical protein